MVGGMIYHNTSKIGYRQLEKGYRASQWVVVGWLL